MIHIAHARLMVFATIDATRMPAQSTGQAGALLPKRRFHASLKAVVCLIVWLVGVGMSF